jgi:hypothetical protein
MPPPRWDRASIIAALHRDARRRGRPPTEQEWKASSRGGWGRERPTAQTAKTIFGSWNAALAAAGFEPRGPGQRVTRRVTCPACGHRHPVPIPGEPARRNGARPRGLLHIRRA